MKKQTWHPGITVAIELAGGIFMGLNGMEWDYNPLHIYIYIFLVGGFNHLEK